jgi:hypothetical protein
LSDNATLQVSNLTALSMLRRDQYLELLDTPAVHCCYLAQGADSLQFERYGDIVAFGGHNGM